MSTTWHKIIFLGVLFAVVVVINTQSRTQEVAIFQDRSSNIAAAERARLSPRQVFVENTLPKSERPTRVEVSESQATVPASGGPLEKNYDAVNGLSLSTTKALVTDLQSGERLYELNTSDRWPLASLSKVMTAVVATKLTPHDQIVQISQADFSPLDTSEFHSLQVGENYKVEDLIRAMMIASSNQAAEALARVPGREAFINEMRNQASDWDMQNTYFGDPAGLSSTNQSTLDDLEKMIGHVWREYPSVFDYSRSSNRAIVDPLTGRAVVLYAIHRYANDPEFRGGKTGYTEAARENLISVFELDGRLIAIVVLGSRDRFGDTEELLQWTKNRLSLI